MDGDSQGPVNVLLPDEITDISPSRRENISADIEIRHRIFGCELIQHAGILLNFPQVVMVTGQNILHRFYYRYSNLIFSFGSNMCLNFLHVFDCLFRLPLRKSLVRYDALSIAMASLLLACKIEEKPKILREVIAVFHRIYQRRKCHKCERLELGGLEYNAWKE